MACSQARLRMLECRRSRDLHKESRYNAGSWKCNTFRDNWGHFNVYAHRNKVLQSYAGKSRDGTARAGLDTPGLGLASRAFGLPNLKPSRELFYRPGLGRPRLRPRLLYNNYRSIAVRTHSVPIILVVIISLKTRCKIPDFDS